MSTRLFRTLVMMMLSLGMVLLGGCFDDSRLGPGDSLSLSDPDSPDGAAKLVQTGDDPPTGLATLNMGGDVLTLWPYTGSSFDGTPVDPINVVFAGQAHPLQIREALMALSGDRSAYGFPPLAPFDARWTDIVGGDVQTAYTDGPLGWCGSIVQLKLGEYGPLRVHLRLFRTCQPAGGGEWTVGGAHFELHIPGTADHQVLSWEIAQQIVMVDLMRCGLLDPAAPMAPSPVISAVPSFRTIPAVIYNGMPAALVGLIGGPAQPVGADVPIANDGRATIFRLKGCRTVRPGSWPQTASLFYDQIVPKPFCVGGPGDFLRVVGPIHFETLVEVTAQGRYTYRSEYGGELEVTSIDMSGGFPVPVGQPRRATVDGQHLGFLDEDAGRVVAHDRRMVLDQGGPEIRITNLVLPERGQRLYTALEQCIGVRP